MRQTKQSQTDSEERHTNCPQCLSNRQKNSKTMEVWTHDSDLKDAES